MKTPTLEKMSETFVNREYTHLQKKCGFQKHRRL